MRRILSKLIEAELYKPYRLFQNIVTSKILLHEGRDPFSTRTIGLSQSSMKGLTSLGVDKVGNRMVSRV